MVDNTIIGFPKNFSALREKNRTERDCPQSTESLGYVNYTKVILRPVNHLILIKSWFSEKSANV